MAPKKRSEKDNRAGENSSLNAGEKPAVPAVDLFSDPGYRKLVDHFQMAAFDDCTATLQELLDKYPAHPELLQFEDDLLMKTSIGEITASMNAKEKIQSKKTLFRMSSFAVIGTLVVLVVFFVSYFFLNFEVTDEIIQAETEQLIALGYQAEQLMNAGQPVPAQEIIGKMIAINPDYEGLPALIIRGDKLLQFEEDYQLALDLITEDNRETALEILNAIEQQEPGLWDVSQQIQSIYIADQIDDYLDVGNAAYEAENWDGVISAYESIFKLDSGTEDPLMKEQLLRSYLNKILSLLDDENTTMQDITQAEEYYRRAIAMVPQSKTFAAERENLQKASSKLLELKFTEIAKTTLNDTEQTITSIDRAVSFLKTSAAIQPENRALQTDLAMAEYYEAGFRNFIELNWDGAIANFDKVYKIDPNYADGNANAMLFEAYYALGKQYFSAGFYLDAINKLEQAEILTWYDTDNLMKLFQTQILLGEAFGKLEDYDNAVSYFQYALNAIQIDNKLGDFDYPEIAAKLAEARNYASFVGIKKGFDAYQEVLKEIDMVFTTTDVEVRNGVCLALVAKENLSTVDAILEANDLPTSMVIAFGRNIKVPIIDR